MQWSRKYWGIGSPASRSSLILAWAMSRATIIGPVSSTRVRTGCCDSSARISGIGRLRSMCTDRRVVELVRHLGQEASWVRLQLLEEDAVTGDLALGLAVGGARHGDRHGTAGAVAGQPNDAHVVAEVLAAELGADAGACGRARAPWPRARRRGTRARTASRSSATCPGSGCSPAWRSRRRTRRRSRR